MALLFNQYEYKNRGQSEILAYLVHERKVPKYKKAPVIASDEGAKQSFNY